MDALAEYGPLAALILVGLYGVGRTLVNHMAAKPQVDGWDKAKRVFDRLEPHVEEIEAWADPDDPSTPPTPDRS